MRFWIERRGVQIFAVVIFALMATSGLHGQSGSALPDSPAPQIPAAAPAAPSVPPAQSKGDPFPEQAAPPKSANPASAADANPFPDEDASPKPTPSTTKNPFPEDEEKNAPLSPGSHESTTTGAAKPEAPPLPPGYSSSAAGHIAFEDEGSHGADISPADAAKRVQHDRQVASLYAERGNWQGAYLRYKDAVAAKPNDADSIFELAEAERHLGHNVDARQHYTRYLELSPDGHRAKSAQKTLAELPATDASKPQGAILPVPLQP